MKIPLLRSFALFLSTFAFGHVCRAEFIVDFSVNQGASFSNRFAAEVGDDLTVDVYLRETGGESRLSDSGLITFASRASFDDSLATVTDVRINSDLFDDLSSSTGIESSTAFSIVGEDPTFIGVAQSNILLGSFTVRITGAGVTEFAFGDFDPRPNVGDFLLGDNDFTEIDAELFSASRNASSTDRSHMYRVSITSVPEPGSAFLLAGLFIFQSHRFQRQCKRRS